MRSDFCYFKLTFQVCYDCTDGCATLPTSGLVSPHPGMTQWRISGQTIVTTGGGGAGSGAYPPISHTVAALLYIFIIRLTRNPYCKKVILISLY